MVEILMFALVSRKFLAMRKIALYSVPFHEVVDSSRELYNVITNIFKILPSKFYDGLSLKDRYWILLCMLRLQTTG